MQTTVPNSAIAFPVVEMALKAMDTDDDACPFAPLFARRGARQAMKAGSTIFIEGEEADVLYRIASGTVRCCRVTLDGRRQIERFLGEGDEMGLTARGVYAYTAEAVGEVVLQRMKRATFEQAAREDAALREALFEHMAETLDASRGRMVLLGRMTASERAAAFLVEMAARLREPGDEIRLPMTRQDIADYLGITLETVSRMFNRFRRDGLIDMAAPDRIRIADRDALEDLASAA